jgi:hypothetical protein
MDEPNQSRRTIHPNALVVAYEPRMEHPRIEAVLLEQMVVVLSNGEVLDIVTLFDQEGDPTESVKDAVAAKFYLGEDEYVLKLWMIELDHTRH